MHATHAPQAPASGAAAAAAIFEHLLDDEFLDIEDVDTPELLAAQARTAQTLPSADPDPWSPQTAAAREAFAAITSPASTPAQQRSNVLNLKVPEAVRHLAGMLSQYDWAFVEQAKEIRGYVVAKLLEETASPDARFRLKSLELLGKVSAVDLFTTRVEVTTRTEGATEIMERIQARLASLLPAPAAPAAAGAPTAASDSDVTDVTSRPAATAAPNLNL